MSAQYFWCSNLRNSDALASAISALPPFFTCRTISCLVRTVLIPATTRDDLPLWEQRVYIVKKILTEETSTMCNPRKPNLALCPNECQVIRAQALASYSRRKPSIIF